MIRILNLSILVLIMSVANAQSPEEKIAKLGVKLPAVTKPVANYANVVQTGNLLYLSGKGPIDAGGKDITGKVGKDLTIDEGYAAARTVAFSHIAVLKDYLGDLKRVKRVVKVLGMVNCESTFTQQPKVMNGYSDTMVEIFGEKGKHARSAVGFHALPNNIAVEVEVIVEIE